MAVIQTGPVVCDIRGKVGDIVFSRNQGGLICFAVPDYVDPNTADQQAARAAITNLSAAWSDVLTEAQRNTWRKYAHQHPLPDRWGQHRLVNGYCYFIRVNARWWRDDASIEWPTAPSIPPLHPPDHSTTAAAGADTVTVGIPTVTYDPAPAGLILWQFAGKPVAPGVQYFNSPWRYTEKNTNVPPWDTDPWIINWPWGFDVGQKVFSKLIAQDLATGAISTPYVTSAIAT